MSDVTCPYCKEDFEVNHDDGAHYKDGESEQDYCPNCGKIVLIYSSCIWSHEAQQADCLNDSPHPFSEWSTLWKGEKNDNLGKFYERRYCKTCGKEEIEWHDVRLDKRPSERFDK